MTGTKRRIVEAEEERMERIWGRGTWKDILPNVFRLLPPRDRFVVSRVSKLFQQTSENARLEVSELRLMAAPGKTKVEEQLQSIAIIHDPKASDGITSLHLNDFSAKFICCEKNFCCCSCRLETRASRLEEVGRRYQQTLAHLNFPNLRQISLQAGPLAQWVLPFLRKHPQISRVELFIPIWGCVKHGEFVGYKALQQICFALPKTNIKTLSIRAEETESKGNSRTPKFFWSEKILEYLKVKKLCLRGVHFNGNGRPFQEAYPRLTELDLDLYDMDFSGGF